VDKCKHCLSGHVCRTFLLSGRIPPKCTLTASHDAPWWVTQSMPTGQTDWRKDGRSQTVTLPFPLHSARAITMIGFYCCPLTRIRWRRQTCATRCLTPIVLYTKVDALCDKLPTDDRHQFVTLAVQLNCQHFWRSRCSCEIFFKSLFWDKVAEKSTLILPNSSITQCRVSN